MKVSRPTSSPPSATAGKVSGVASKGRSEFAARLDKAGKAGGKTPVEAGASSPTAGARASSISDIGADLTAGRITPDVAIDKVIDRIVAQQLGIHATPAAREQIGAALRERLADDPLLAAKVRALSDG
jgi:hypothetical protein